jgi:hypothetical protein
MPTYAITARSKQSAANNPPFALSVDSVAMMILPETFTKGMSRLSKVIFLNLERLDCKRSVLCLASSKILTPAPPPSPPGECVPPAFGAGGGHTFWVERGVGVNILEDARHSSVLNVCKYFVPLSLRE